MIKIRSTLIWKEVKLDVLPPRRENSILVAIWYRSQWVKWLAMQWHHHGWREMKRNILLDFLAVLSRFFSPFTEFITYSFRRRASACSLCVHNAPLRLSTLLERTSGFVSRFSLHSGVITIIHTDVHGHARFHVFPQPRVVHARWYDWYLGIFFC